MLQINLPPWLLGFFALVSSSLALAAANESADPLGQLPCRPSYASAATGFDFLATKQEHRIPPGSRIGRIRYTRLAIFDESDPKENRWFYRWVNRVHVITKPGTLQQQLLFEGDDPYDDRIIKESARILRSDKYLADATIRPVSFCDDRVDVEVISRDVWSLSPEASFIRSGGKSTFRFSLRETNLFGSGKELAISGKRDVDRDSTDIRYKDSNLFGSRVVTRLRFIDSDDGSTKLARLSLPFYALDTRRSWGVSAEQRDVVDSQYFSAVKVSQVRHETTFYQAFYGFSKGLNNGVARRFSVGYQLEEHQFSLAEELPPPALLPRDRRLSYPFLRYESVADSYAESFNLEQIQRTEDLHLGRRVIGRIGYSTTDGKRLVLDGRLRNMHRLQHRSLLQHQLSWQGFWNLHRSEVEELQLQYELQYFRSQTDKRSFFAALSASYVKNISTDKQLQLGGNNGVRGYPQRFASGDRSYLLSLEQRMYTNLHILQLVRVGWAVFFDMGKAWFPGGDNGAGNELLKNVGIGLRLSSSKAELGKMMHLDIAYPMDRRDDPEVDSIQFLVTMKNSF